MTGSVDAGEYSVYVYARDGYNEPVTKFDSAIGYSGYQLVGPIWVRQITSTPNIADKPSLTYADGGYTLAYQSWEAGEIFGEDIILEIFDEGWDLIDRTEITRDHAYQDAPTVIYSGDHYYVAYVSDETGSRDIFLTKLDRSLNPIETRRLTTSLADQDNPSIARRGDSFYLAYQSWETGESYNGDIFIERLSPSLTTIRKVRVTTERSYQDRPRLALGDDGNLYVAYSSEEFGNLDIFVNTYDSDLNFLSKKRITHDLSDEDYPSLIWQNGEFILVYSSDKGGSFDLYLERFDPDWNSIDKIALTGYAADVICPSSAYSQLDGLVYLAYVHQGEGGGNIFVQPAASIGATASCLGVMDLSSSAAGSPYTLTVRFFGEGGELADPSNLRLTWDPADSVLTSSDLVRISEGVYCLDLIFGSTGFKTFRIYSTIGDCADNTLTVEVN